MEFCGIQTILSYDLQISYKDFKPIAKSLAVVMIQNGFYPINSSILEVF